MVDGVVGVGNAATVVDGGAGGETADGRRTNVKTFSVRSTVTYKPAHISWSGITIRVRSRS